MMIEKTCFIVKPDGIPFQWKIIERISDRGLSISSAKKVPKLSADKCWRHYQKDERWYLENGMRIMEDRKARGLEVTKSAIEYGKDIIANVVEYMTSELAILMIIEGEDAVGVVKELVGGTDPSTADPGTIRRDYGFDSFSLAAKEGRCIRNLVHCSDSLSEAEREIGIWFEEEVAKI